jgi:hypothetical protein
MLLFGLGPSLLCCILPLSFAPLPLRLLHLRITTVFFRLLLLRLLLDLFKCWKFNVFYGKNRKANCSAKTVHIF